jgi:hypothetical protein
VKDDTKGKKAQLFIWGMKELLTLHCFHRPKSGSVEGELLVTEKLEPEFMVR